MASSTSDLVACFQSMEVSLKVTLEPVDLVTPLAAIENQLSRLLFHYNDDLGGVPLALSQTRFAKGKECGRILGCDPWVHVDIIASIVVFKPAVKSQATGKIMKVSQW